MSSSSSSYKSNNSIGFWRWILKCANWWLLLVGISRSIYCQIDHCYCEFFSLWEEDDSLLQLGFRFFTHLRIGISGSLFWIPQFYLSQWEEILNVTASMKVSDVQPWRHLDPQPISQHHEEEKASGNATNQPASWGRRKQNLTLKDHKWCAHISPRKKSKPLTESSRTRHDRKSSYTIFEGLLDERHGEHVKA